jgi:hypothetical protein
VPSPDAHATAPAVEVVAMLGDSVVGVRHCVDPTSGRVRPATWAMLATSIAALLAFGITFWAAVERAAENQRHYEYETTVLRKPGFAVRPQPLPGGYDWLAFGGLLVSIVTCAAALARMSEERRSPFVRIGTAAGVDFPIAESPAPDFALVAPHGGTFALRFPDGATLSPIPTDAKIRVNIGATTFLVSSIERPRRHAVPLFEIDSELTRTLAATATAFGIFVVLLLQIPIEADSASIDVDSLEITEIAWTSTDQDPAPSQVDSEGAGGEAGGTGKSMAFDAGKMGRKDAAQLAGTYMLAKQLENPQLAREEAIEHARAAGILGSAQLNGDVMAAITGESDFSSGFEDVTIYGGKLGVAPGEMAGGFGFARSSFGPGGGGGGWGTICAGDFGTIGHGSGTGEGYGIGGGRCGTTCRGHSAATPSVSIGQPTATGDLDKAIIRRYLRRSINKIAYCYESRLLTKPHLSGTLATQFFIAPTGKVTSATAEGVDEQVASCVADVISNIEFPKPKDGGGVQVSYPFTFDVAGQ